MTQFGNKIVIIPSEDVLLVSTKAVSLLRNDRKITLYTSNDVVITPNPQVTEAGNLYQYTIIVTVSHFKQARLYSNIKMVLELYNTEGDKYFLGDKDFPVKCSIKEFINSYQITFSLSTPKPFLLK